VNKKLLLVGSFLILVAAGSLFLYFCYFGTSLKVDLKKSDITINFKLGHLKLQEDEPVELHTYVLKIENKEEKEVLFFRNQIQDKSLKTFSWKGDGLELEEGTYVVHSQLLKISPVFVPELLYEKKQKIKL